MEPDEVDEILTTVAALGAAAEAASNPDLPQSTRDLMEDLAAGMADRLKSDLPEED